MIDIKKLPTFRQHLNQSLKDPKFKKAWQESEPEYLLARQIIEKRLRKKMSQRDLAKKSQTTQAVISRLESMNANPSISLLKKIAQGLETTLYLKI